MAGPTTKGFQWDDASDELRVYVGTTEVAAFSATSGVTTPLASAFTGEAEFAGNVHIQSTLEAGADGVGADGEQLTSGGAGAACDWAAAGSMRQFKKLLGIRDDYDEALNLVVSTPVYDFQYKRKDETTERITTTGDTETVYTGIMADEAPWLMHHGGRILNPINTTGYLMLAIKALAAKVNDLEGQLQATKA